MSNTNFRRTKFACYAAYFTMSSVFCLPPLLFVTLRDMYHISYTLLGTLVLVNFCTQLMIDLIFSVYSKKFNVKAIVKIMPLITSLGLFTFALVPTLFPNVAYVGLVAGTVIFSLAAGFSEVLLSPTIAAIPSKNPQRDMSFLHSLYAFGVFFVVIVTTVFFKLFSTDKWAYLTMFFALLPIIAAVLFFLSPMPDISGNTEEKGTQASKRKRMGIAICFACIFFGAAAECAMSNWISGYMENALHIDKAVGDIVGMAAFAILLGLGRIGYARFGKNVSVVLLVGMSGAIACYLVAGLCVSVVPTLIACMLTGVFTSMLWPGTLMLMEEKLPGCGVTAYALMAAGGDLGASVSSQLFGVVADGVSASGFAQTLSLEVGLTVEQIGLKAGMLVCAIFPIIGVAVLLFGIGFFKRKAVLEKEQGLLKGME